MTIPSVDIPWLLQRNGAEAALWLVTLTNWEGGGSDRMVENTEDFTSRGMVFSAWPLLNLVPPGDGDDAPTASMDVPNVDRRFGLDRIEGNGPVTATFEMVRPSAPDDVIYAARGLKLRSAEIHALVVNCLFSAAEYETEPYINLLVSPGAFPGLARMVR